MMTINPFKSIILTTALTGMMSITAQAQDVSLKIHLSGVAKSKISCFP